MKKFLAYVTARFQGSDACQFEGKEYISIARLTILGSVLISVLISKQSFTGARQMHWVGISTLRLAVRTEMQLTIARMRLICKGVLGE
jgi:hypothetical protein